MQTENLKCFDKCRFHVLLQVKILILQGGKDAADKTRAVMHKLMSSKLMTECNLEGPGQKNKTALKNLSQKMSVIFGMLLFFSLFNNFQYASCVCFIELLRPALTLWLGKVYR